MADDYDDLDWPEDVVLNMPRNVVMRLTAIRQEDLHKLRNENEELKLINDGLKHRIELLQDKRTPSFIRFYRFKYERYEFKRIINKVIKAYDESKVKKSMRPLKSPVDAARAFLDKSRRDEAERLRREKESGKDFLHS